MNRQPLSARPDFDGLLIRLLRARDPNLDRRSALRGEPVDPLVVEAFLRVVSAVYAPARRRRAAAAA